MNDQSSINAKQETTVLNLCRDTELLTMTTAANRMEIVSDLHGLDLQLLSVNKSLERSTNYEKALLNAVDMKNLDDLLKSDKPCISLDEIRIARNPSTLRSKCEYLQDLTQLLNQPRYHYRSRNDKLIELTVAASINLQLHLAHICLKVGNAFVKSKGEIFNELTKAVFKLESIVDILTMKHKADLVHLPVEFDGIVARLMSNNDLFLIEDFEEHKLKFLQLLQLELGEFSTPDIIRHLKVMLIEYLTLTKYRFLLDTTSFVMCDAFFKIVGESKDIISNLDFILMHPTVCDSIYILSKLLAQAFFEVNKGRRHQTRLLLNIND